MRLGALVGPACLWLATAAQPAAGQFTSSLPDEFRVYCAGFRSGPDPEADYAARLARGDVAAARALWRGHSRRHAADIVAFLAKPGSSGDDVAALRREVEAALRPEAVLKELKDGEYRWGTWLAYLRPHKDLVAPLLAALKDRPDYRWETIVALGGSRDPRALDPLLGLLKGKDGQTPGDAAYALGLLGDPRAEPALIDALAVDDVWRRFQACRALARVGTSKALPALEKLANGPPDTPDLSAEGVAREAVARIERRCLPRDPARWPAGPPPKPVAVLGGHDGTVRGLAFSLDGKRLASVGDDEDGRVWDPATAKVTATFSAPGRAGALVVFAGPDLLATAGYRDSGAVLLFDIRTGSRVALIDAVAGGVGSLAASADGRRVAASDADDRGPVRLFDVETSAEVAALRTAAQALAFGPDGKVLATTEAGTPSRVQVWDVATAKVIANLRGHTGPVRSAAFTLDRRAVATGGDWTVRVWDAETGKETARFRGDSDVTCVAFSPDGKRVAAVEADGLVRVWDVRAGKAVAVVAARGPVTYSPDGRRLATAAADGPDLLLWDPPGGDSPRK